MGWLYLYSCDTKESIVQHIKQTYKLVDYSVRGNVIYGLCPLLKNIVDDFGDIQTISTGYYITVFMLGTDNKIWGYKDIDESCGPLYYDCPKRILLKSTVEDTRGWRKKCLEKSNSKVKLIENAWYQFTVPLKGVVKWQYKRLKRNWKKDQMYWQSECGIQLRIENVLARFNPCLVT